MSEKSPSKDEALEALDFIVNVLKEHEKDLDKLVSELGTVAGQLGESGELSGKVKKIEDKLNAVQNDVSNIVKSFTASPRETSPIANIAAVSKDGKPEGAISSSTSSSIGNLPLLFQCKQWGDFQVLAAQAQTVSFVVKDSEKNIQVNALRSNKVVAYNGEIPKLSLLVKAYLSKLLGLPEERILEGEITLL